MCGAALRKALLLSLTLLGLLFACEQVYGKARADISLSTSIRVWKPQVRDPSMRRSESPGTRMERASESHVDSVCAVESYFDERFAGPNILRIKIILH